MASEYKTCECGNGFTTTTGSSLCHACRKASGRNTPSAHRRQREQNAPGTHTSKQWFDRIDFQNNLCFWCFKSMMNDSQMFTGTKDHLVPLSRGGTNYIENIVAACWPCNREKGTKTATEYQAYLAKKISEVSTLTAPTKRAFSLPLGVLSAASLTVRESIFEVSRGKAMAIPVVDYTARRELLKQQARSMGRRFQEAAGQMQLSLEMPSSIKKAVEHAGEATELAVRKGLDFA